MPDREEWLSTRQAAARLGVTLRSLYRFIDEGEVTAYKFGRVIRLRAADVDSYIESCRIAPGDLEHLHPSRKGDPGDEQDPRVERDGRDDGEPAG